MTNPAAIIGTDLVLLDVDAGTDKESVIDRIAGRLADAGRVSDRDALKTAALAREAQSATGLPGGIAIPHCRSAAVRTPSIGFARLAPKVDFGAPDGPADLVFLIAAPDGAGSEHMKLLSSLARALVRPEFVASLRAAKSAEELVGLVDGVVNPDREPAAAPVPAPKTAAAKATSIIAITACPTGIAHTYMAAEGLERAAKAAGHEILVETQGSAGSKPLTAAQIAEADGVIFAHDLPVKDVGRFAGKPTVDVGVKKGISDGPQLVTEIENLVDEWSKDPSKAAAAAAAGAGAAAGGGGMATKVDTQASVGTRIRQVLMTGVSYMIPFVAAGGILIALGFMVAQFAGGKQGAIDVTAQYTLNPGSTAEGVTILQNSFDPLNGMHWAALLFLIGAAAFGFLVPILSGFIAYAIADRPGLVPGIVGGSVAATMGTGFLGGLVTGFLGGYLAKWVASWKVHKNVRGVMPVVVIPMVSTLITIGLFITVIGRPIKGLSDALASALNGMGGSSAIVLGLILGAMMGFDLGGPVNKVAYAFATTGLAAAGTATDAVQLKIMAAVMAAGMVAPLAMALATSVRPKLFTEPERENGKAAWLLGASFISEGAIPFAAADPFRVIASSVVGSAVTGAIAMATGVTSRAPHGGIWVLPLIGNFLMFVVALVIGVLVMAAIVLFLKQRDHSRAAVTEAVEA